MDDTLLNAAMNAKLKSYAPYSNFHVGAALKTKSGKIYEGTNIENAAYGETVCAERTAAFAAVINGETEFESIAITSDSNDFTPPCGSCRQVLSELCGNNLKVFIVKNNGEYKKFNLNELLPFSFTNKQLGDK